MPDIPQTEDLEALVTDLISKASAHLQRQLDDVRRHAESVHDQAQELVKVP
jgi:hypothetical protein